jgi:hypothetical protein
MYLVIKRGAGGATMQPARRPGGEDLRERSDVHDEVRMVRAGKRKRGGRLNGTRGRNRPR